MTLVQSMVQKWTMTSRLTAKYLQIRNGTYVYRRAIPQRWHKLAGKREFKESLRTQDHDTAMVRYLAAHERAEVLFRDLQNGTPPTTRQVLPPSELEKLANSLGLSYLSARELAAGPNEEFLRRANLWAGLGRPQDERFQAIFGEAPKPTTFTDCLALYENSIMEQLAPLNSHERKKKMARKRRAIDVFIEFLEGDRDFRDVDQKKAREFKALLQKKVADGVIKGHTANKYLGDLSTIYQVNLEDRDITGLINPFVGLRLKEQGGRRDAFSVEFIKKHWLVEGAFDGLNIECRNLLMTMLDTGCGVKELCGLNPEEDIKLDHEIPHIVIRPNDLRQLKTPQRKRAIPLIGYAFRAMKEQPGGFPSYRRPNGPNTASATIMKHLKRHKLQETSNQTATSLRHTFKDRMRLHRIPSDLQNHLMGHKDPTMGAHYGSGYSLQQTYEYLKPLENDFS